MSQAASAKQVGLSSRQRWTSQYKHELQHMREPTYIYIEWELVPTYKLFLACNARSISIPSNSVVAPILDKFRL